MNLVEPISRLESVAEGWCICSMPDGRLAFQTKDHSLCLWNPESGRLDQIPLPHRVFDLDEMAPLDSVRLVTVGKDDCMAVWDTVAFHELRRTSFEWNGTPYYRPDKVCAGDGWFALGFYRGHIGVYDSGSFELLAELPADDSEVWTLRALPGKRLLYGRSEGDVGIWDWSSGEAVTLRDSGRYGHSWWIETADRHLNPPDGFETFGLSELGTVVSWQRRKGVDAYLAAEPHWLLIGKEDGSVEFYNLKTGDLAAIGQGGWIVRDICSMPGNRVASLSELGSVSVWELPYTDPPQSN